MVQVSFGTVLHNARERKGFDIATVARRLRIRPDILEAIEASDFDRMPPKGYARNMINAYARYLGLNPTEVTSMYLDECYAHQVKTARSNARPTGLEMPSSSLGRRSSQQKGEAPKEEVPRQSKFGRTLYIDDRRPSSQNGDLNGSANRHYSEDRSYRGSRAAAPSTQYTNFYSGPRAPRSRLPFIIGGAVILILLIVVLVLVFGPKGGDADTDIQKVPVTGITGSNSSDQNSQVELAPTKLTFEYEVKDGDASYVEIYQGDDLVDSGTKVGPVKEPLDVTGVLRFDTSNPDGVKVYQDGKELQLKDDDGDGVYSVTVDFPAYLDQWKKDHKSVTSGSGGTGSTDGSATNNNTAANAADAGGSAQDGTTAGNASPNSTASNAS